MKFTKWHGLGNDFIIPCQIDFKSDDISALAVKLCDRHFGIGADGLCLLETSEVADMRMRLINSDGSEAEMCGNLIRCVAKYLYEENICRKEKMQIETLSGIMKPELVFENTEITGVKVEMAVPKRKRGQIPVAGDIDEEALCLEVSVAGETFTGTALSMGNPHFVIFVENVETFPVAKYGPLLETNAIFPKKANIEFVKIINEKKVRMRVWERGAGITLACGTGSCATVVAGILNGFLDKSVEVILDGGSLFIDWPDIEAPVYMTGPAEKVFTGEI